MAQTHGFDVPLSANRRENARYNTAQQAAECPVRSEDGQNHQAQVLDVSAGGVGLLMDRRFEPGSFLSVVLPTKDEEGSHRFTVRVQKCEQDTTGKWRIGCAFAHPLTDGDVLLLM
jgi:hypothetical protein